MCIVICTLLLSRPARGAWVEMVVCAHAASDMQSRPARGAWVEIRTIQSSALLNVVAPRKGRVG